MKYWNDDDGIFKACANINIHSNNATAMITIILLFCAMCSKRYTKLLWTKSTDRHRKWRQIEAVKRVANVLQKLVDPKETGVTPKWSAEANRCDTSLHAHTILERNDVCFFHRRTVAIMPFLGGAMGAGHSEVCI